MTRAVVCTVLGVILLGVASAQPLWCAAQEPKLGVVNMERIAGEYRHMAELNQQFQDFQRDQERQLQDKHKARLLTDAERQEYLDLSAMAAPTDARRQRLQELEELSNQRERRLFELREKKDRTADEEAEFKQWDGLYEIRMSELASLQAELQASRAAKYEELSKIVADNVQGAVKAVADAQKLAVVVRKDAVLYGGVDITDAVLEKLNGEGGEKGESAK